jgi:hypothetical protein
MSETHADLIDISITLAAPPVSQAGFGRVAFFAEDVSFTGGDRYKVYSTNQAAQDDTDLTSAAKDAASVAFSQTPQPDSFMVVDVDVAGSESYEEAFNAAVADGAEFYGVTTESRTDTDHASMDTAIQASAHRAIALYQSADSDWLTATIPSGYSALESSDRAAVVYHDTASEYADVAALAGRLAFDPDTTSAAFQCALNSVGPYATGLTSSDEDNAEGNEVNLVMPFGPEPQYFSPGVALSGRALYEMVTRDWFEARLRERVTQLKLDFDARGEKIPLSAEGQNLLGAEIEGQLNQGVQIGHFLPLNDEEGASFPTPIPDADITAQVLKGSGSARFESNAAEFEFDFNFSRT